MSIDAALRGLREDLNEIAAVEACAACECLLGVAAQALADVRRIPGDEARDAEGDLRRILAAGREAAQPCHECDPCLPVEPYRRFAAARSELGTGMIGGGAAGATAAAPPSDTPPACRGCGCDGCT
ncbi:MAG: hypothetical protein WC709_08090 [Thermoleophilia bacterium]